MFNNGILFRKFSPKNNPSFSFTVVIFLLIAAGFLIRLRYYVFNPSLWMDEAWGALDIMYSSLQNLIFAAPANHSTPIGFNVIEKLATLGLGPSEYALMAIPFLFSLIGYAPLLPHTYSLCRARRFHSPCFFLFFRKD